MTKDIFFDRQHYLEILEKRVSGIKDGYRQNIALIGDELIGKTTIIFKFLNKFYDNRIIPIYLEIRPESISSFAKRFIGILLYNFLINSAMPLKEDIGFLLKNSKKYIPRTVERAESILNAVERRKSNNIFADLLTLCEIINQESGKFCIVIFDEFQNLETLGFKNLYREWSRLLISQKNTLYIIVSSLKCKARAILSKQLSLLFGNFEVITVEPFDIRTCEQYLNYKLRDLNLNRAFKNFIIHFTGGYPMYLEVIANALLKSDKVNVTDTLENLLFLPLGILNQKFSNYSKRFLDSDYSSDYIRILYLIASGQNRIKDIAHILRKQKKELLKRVNRLLELDTITRNGDFLKINDRVFGFWIKFVYQEKLHSLTFDARNQKTFFRENIEGMVQEFLLSAQKPIPERMLEVLNLFGNEIMQIEKKKIRLNHFREIKPLEFNNRNLKSGLIGRSSDSLWIMGFKQDLLTEEDITDFAKECRKYRHKLQRKIIITLQDIDTNTKLRALEEKVWTWDLDYVNQLLDLFSKPRVIV